MWGENGLRLCVLDDTQGPPEIDTDGAGGGLIAWSDTRSGPVDIYAQSTAYLVPSGIESTTLPDRFAVWNSPNPFRAATRFTYALAAPTLVSLRIFDSMGRPTRILVNEWREAGRHESIWDGRNDTGASVPHGVYYYRFAAGEWVSTDRLVWIQ